MNENISDDEYYNIIKPYFDYRFKDSVIDNRPYEGIGRWIGFWRDDELLVGYPENDPVTWFCNDQIFGEGILIFTIGPKIFYKLMKHYINTNFPDINIKKLF